MKKKTLLKTMFLLCALVVGTSSVWGQVSSATPTNGGTYVVAAYVNNKYYALPNGTVNGSTIAGTEITLNVMNKVNTSTASGKTWTLEEGTTSGQFYLKYTSGSDTYYLYKNGTGGSNYNFAVNKTNKNYWSFSPNGTGYTVTAIDRGTNNTKIQCNSGTFRCYSSATPIRLLEVGDVPALSSIALSGTYKTSFYVDDEFTYEGLVVTATFANGTSSVVTPTSVSTPDMTTDGIKTVTVTYTLDQVTETATYEITVSVRPKFTVTLNDGGSLTEETVGNGVILPSRQNTADYTFVGWSETEITAGSTSVTTIEAGRYYPTDDITLYPIYSYSCSEPVEQWAEITEVPTEGEYVIASDNNYAMKASVSSNRFENVSITITAGSPATLAAAPETNYIWEITKPDSYFRIKNGSNYAGGTNAKNQGALLEDADDNLAKWTITYNEGFAFENYGRSLANTDYGNKWLRNNGSSGWGTYSSTQDKAPRLFKKGYTIAVKTLYTSDPVGLGTISINAACTDGEGKYYGTYSNSCAFVVPAYLTVSTISVSGETLTLTNYSTGDVVKANTGVMVSSTTSGNHTVALSTEEGTEKSGNMLKPSGDTGITDAAMEIAAPNCFYYRLTMHNNTTIGFYWGEEDGAAFEVAANKAYLAVPTSVGARLTGFSLFGGDATIVKELKNSSIEELKFVYDLQGRRVQSSKFKDQSSKLKPGLYIVNGKKTMVK